MAPSVGWYVKSVSQHEDLIVTVIESCSSVANSPLCVFCRRPGPGQSAGAPPSIPARPQ